MTKRFQTCEDAAGNDIDKADGIDSDQFYFHLTLCQAGMWVSFVMFFLALSASLIRLRRYNDRENLRVSMAKERRKLLNEDLVTDVPAHAHHSHHSSHHHGASSMMPGRGGGIGAAAAGGRERLTNEEEEDDLSRRGSGAEEDEVEEVERPRPKRKGRLAGVVEGVAGVAQGGSKGKGKGKGKGKKGKEKKDSSKQQKEEQQQHQEVEVEAEAEVEGAGSRAGRIRGATGGAVASAEERGGGGSDGGNRRRDPSSSSGGQEAFGDQQDLVRDRRDN